MEKFRVAIVGCGTVGGGVAKILTEISDKLAVRANKTIELARIVELNAVDAIARFGIDSKYFVDGNNNITAEQAGVAIKEILEDKSINLVIETVGGKGDFVYNLCLDVVKSGKHLVTANKALLATRGKAIFQAALDNNVTIGYEASVCGAIPAIKTIKESFSGDEIVSVSGIMNGTSNYILSSMQNKKLGFSEALKMAQDNGYAEADPTLDINGGDAGHKMVILIKLAYGIDVNIEDLPIIGIENIDIDDIEFAAEINAKIKLIGYALRKDNDIYATVRPMMVKNDNFLSSVDGATNALRFQNRYSGTHILVGEGAGSEETASSIVGDIVFAARYNSNIKNETAPQNFVFCDDKHFEFPYLITFSTENAPGITGFIATEIGAMGINIDTVSHNRHESSCATFSVATTPCKIGQINEAIKNIKTKRPEILVAEPKIMPILYSDRQ